jgi:hemerythrin
LKHKQLVGMINNLNEAMCQGQGKLVLESILNKLVNYFTSHFATEELLLTAHGYPDFDAHKEVHEKMTSKVLALQQEYHRGKLSLSNEVMDFLKDWLDKHILGKDMKYTRFLAGKGVK